MKKAIYSLSLMLASMSVASCSDFFDPESDDQLNGTEYIADDTEMYTGFLGLMTHLQKVGDREILLTETRGELMETTTQSTPELIDIYNYVPDLTGNSYATPAPYYELVIACNDYLTKMAAYKNLPGVDPDVWADLVSSTLRLKVWAYKTIGEIYGEAVWFDTDVTKVEAVKPENGFVLTDMAGIADRCLQLLDGGWNGVTTDRQINWVAWLDPSNVTSVADSKYRVWNYMVPARPALLAELLLWKAAAIEGLSADVQLSSDATRPLYLRAVETILGALDEWICNSRITGNPPYWVPSAASSGKWGGVFKDEKNMWHEAVSLVYYDYTNNQTNSLLKHFSNEYPNLYLLAPSQVGIDRYQDPSFSPGTSADIKETRWKESFGKSSGVYYMAKYRNTGSSTRPQPYQDDVHIHLYRATQYHTMLAEALNHLGYFEPMQAVIDDGVEGKLQNGTDADGNTIFKSDDPANFPEWKGFNRNWTKQSEFGTNQRPQMGVRMCHKSCGFSSREFLNEDAAVTVGNVKEMRPIYRHNDMEILKECILEFDCEGKNYPLMNRMAMRYNDPSIVADIVCPKYEPYGTDGIVRGRIMDGGNWVKYDLQTVGQDLRLLGGGSTVYPSNNPDFNPALQPQE